jgi:hypothetical protein
VYISKEHLATTKHFSTYIYEEHLAATRHFSAFITEECLAIAKCFLIYIVKKCLAVAKCFSVYNSHLILLRKHREMFGDRQGFFNFTSDTYGVKFLGFFHMKVYTPFVKEGDWTVNGV